MTPEPPVNDEADMLALQRGEELALNRLMDRWQTPLRSFLYRRTQNEADALDLAQETFVRVYQHRARFRSGAKFSTWMFQIALNLARDDARRHRRRPTESLANAPEPVTELTPKTELARQERAAAVRAAIAELPDDLRDAVLLSEYEDKSHAEIAGIVGATPKAVETRLYRAREHLRKALGGFLQTG
jgi:RNA polymerase sigma factor (sigma-70 family)